MKKSQATIALAWFSGRCISAGLLIRVAVVVACCIWPPCAARAESAASATAHRQCVVLPRLDSQLLNAGSNSLTAAVTGGLPTGLDFQRQNRRNALRCQPIKVAGFTISNALRQSNQRASLQNTNLSAGSCASLSSPVPGIE